MGPSQPSLVERARRYSCAVRAIRRHFEQQDFVEVDTPVLLAAPAQEDFIDPVPVEIARPRGAPRQLFLQPSPELAMKCLVAAGMDKIFQVACVFRDGDESPRHRPEFRLLEWYRRDVPLEALMDDCEALIDTVAAALVGIGVDVPRWQRPYRRIRVAEAFAQHIGFDPLDAARLPQLLRGAGIFFDPHDTPAELFGRVFAGIVEPKMLAEMAGAPFFLTHYPSYEAALARLSPHDSRTAERFELYGASLELGNAFAELDAPAEQRARFEATRAARVRRNQRTFPLDEAYLAALERLGDTCGIAVGLERLMMALCGEDRLAAVVPWPSDGL